jgi:hypothetical protein
MKKSLLLGLFAPVAAVVAVAVPATAGANIGATYVSNRWAGYMAQSPARTTNGVLDWQFGSVSTHFQQPAVTCAKGTPQNVSMWAGLGGVDATKTWAERLVQIGTVVQCDGKSTTPQAPVLWWEVTATTTGGVPQDNRVQLCNSARRAGLPACKPSFAIHPGDDIWVSVFHSYNTNQMGMSMEDVRQGSEVGDVEFYLPAWLTGSQVRYDHAECIEEPIQSSPANPLPNVGTTNWADCVTAVQDANSISKATYWMASDLMSVNGGPLTASNLATQQVLLFNSKPFSAAHPQRGSTLDNWFPSMPAPTKIYGFQILQITNPGAP